MTKTITLFLSLFLFTKIVCAQTPCTVTIQETLIDSFCTATATCFDTSHASSTFYRWTYNDSIGHVLQTTTWSITPNFSCIAPRGGHYILTLYDSIGATGCTNNAHLTIYDTFPTNIPSCQAVFVLYPDTSAGNYIAYNYSTGNNLSYTWYWGDGSSSTSATPTHTYFSSGYYIVSLKVSSGTCSDSASVNYFVARMNGANPMHTITVKKGTSPSGITNTLNQNFKIYPNPTNGLATIALTKSIDNATIKLISLTGQTIIEKQNQTGDHFNLDISQQAQGIYFIEVQQQSNVWRGKIVKQ